MRKTKIEHVDHIKYNNEKITLRYYLAMKHDAVARTMWNRIKTERKHQDTKLIILKRVSQKYEWKLLSISYSLDTSVVRKTQEKGDFYRLRYTFRFISIIIGATRQGSSRVEQIMVALGSTGRECNFLILNSYATIDNCIWNKKNKLQDLKILKDDHNCFFFSQYCYLVGGQN